MKLLRLNVEMGGELLHWLDSGQARGWLRPGAGQAALSEQRVDQELQLALAAGYVEADAAIIACLRAAGVEAPRDGTVLPQLTWGEEPLFVPLRAPAPAPLGLYAIVDSLDRLRQVLDAGVATVQLRIKTPAAPDAAWPAWLRAQLAEGIALARGAGALLFINDHWALASELGAGGVHLGQEDLLALGAAGRRAIVASGVPLGISSHSLWELCRARSLAPRYVACGPVWPTTTKDMPWLPQGEDNLRWWVRVAGAPVVAIGGILEAAQVEQVAAWGADGVCIVRGLGESPAGVLPGLGAALERGWSARDGAAPDWLHPSLP